MRFLEKLGHAGAFIFFKTKFENFQKEKKKKREKKKEAHKSPLNQARAYRGL